MLKEGKQARQISIVGCCLLVSLFMASASHGQGLIKGAVKAGKTAQKAVIKKSPKRVKVITPGGSVKLRLPPITTATHIVESTAKKANIQVIKTPSKVTASATKTLGTLPSLKPSVRVSTKATSGISANFIERKVAQAQALKKPQTSEEISASLKADTGVKFGPVRSYSKFARVQAVEAKGGEAIETILADGTRETTNVANPGDWIVTNPGGERYIVPAEKFVKKYEPAAELGEGWFKPTGGSQKFVQITEDMDVVASWGEVQHLKKGAYLNVTNLGDIYGVAEQEFHATYKLEGVADGAVLKELYLGKSPLLKGTAQTYTKFARIQAEKAKGGEAIETILADGTKETTNVANPGDWIVTNPGGERYIVPAEKFVKKYEPAVELGEGWFKPTGGNQSFIQIDADMDILASWGEVQHLKKGAYLNVTNLNDIYGVAEQEFHDTYKLVQ